MSTKKNAKTNKEKKGVRPSVKSELLGDLECYEEDYAFDYSIWNDSADEKAEKVKWILDNRLTVAERKLFLLWLDRGYHYTELALLFGVSDETLSIYMKRIKMKILNEYDKIKDSESWKLW